MTEPVVATSGRYASLVGPLALSAAASSAVYADTTTYPSSTTNFARVSLSTGNVFKNNTASQRGQQTPVLTGEPSASYVGTATIRFAR